MGSGQGKAEGMGRKPKRKRGKVWEVKERTAGLSWVEGENRCGEGNIGAGGEIREGVQGESS